VTRYPSHPKIQKQTHTLGIQPWKKNLQKFTRVGKRFVASVFGIFFCLSGWLLPNFQLSPEMAFGPRNSHTHTHVRPFSNGLFVVKHLSVPDLWNPEPRTPNLEPAKNPFSPHLWLDVTLVYFCATAKVVVAVVKSRFAHKHTVTHTRI